MQVVGGRKGAAGEAAWVGRGQACSHGNLVSKELHKHCIMHNASAKCHAFGLLYLPKLVTTLTSSSSLRTTSKSKSFPISLQLQQLYVKRSQTKKDVDRIRVSAG